MKTKLTQKQLQEKQIAISKVITDVWEEAGPDSDFSNVKSLGEGDTNAKLEKLKTITAELSDYHADLKEWESISKSRQLAEESVGFKGGQPGRESPGGTKGAQKSIAEQFVKSVAYLEKGKESMLDIELKSIMQTGAGWAPESMRQPGVTLYPLRSLKVMDVFPTFTTDRDTIKFMEETTHTNNAAEIAEETNAASPTAFGEAAIAMTERSVPVEKIAVWIPVTDEQLSDIANIGAWIESRLRYMVQNRLDVQLVAGNGTTPNLRGVLNATNVQSQALGTDPVPDAFFKAMTKVRGTTAGTGFAEPSAILIHPNDWEGIRLARTADGIYIFGNPTESGPERLWGIPVVVSSAETENTGIVGDFANFAELHVRNGVEIKVTDSHGSLFISGVQAVRATMRCAAVYRRGSAFCKVTGI